MGSETRHEFEACVTDLEPAVAKAWQIVELYRKRAAAAKAMVSAHRRPMGAPTFPRSNLNPSASTAEIWITQRSEFSLLPCFTTKLDRIGNPVTLHPRSLSHLAAAWFELSNR